jgi:hypothetical protein
LSSPSRRLASIGSATSRSADGAYSSPAIAGCSVRR